MAGTAIIRTGNRFAKLVKARTKKKCRHCPAIIYPGDMYWRVIVGGGLGAIKFPNTVCVLCLDTELGESGEEEV